jgi:hypothetical protein
MVAAAYPPEIPENARAACFHRPARKVVTAVDNSHTGINDLGDKGAEGDLVGMRSARNVERWT